MPANDQRITGKSTVCPKGTSENSPAIHRWECVIKITQSPEGTTEWRLLRKSPTPFSVVPTGLTPQCTNRVTQQ
jgi:hypothetical protein